MRITKKIYENWLNKADDQDHNYGTWLRRKYLIEFTKSYLYWLAEIMQIEGEEK